MTFIIIVAMLFAPRGKCRSRHRVIADLVIVAEMDRPKRVSDSAFTTGYYKTTAALENF